MYIHTYIYFNSWSVSVGKHKRHFHIQYIQLHTMPLLLNNNNNNNSLRSRIGHTFLCAALTGGGSKYCIILGSWCMEERIAFQDIPYMIIYTYRHLFSRGWITNASMKAETIRQVAMIMITDTPLFVMNAAESCSINITCEAYYSMATLPTKMKYVIFCAWKDWSGRN